MSDSDLGPDGIPNDEWEVLRAMFLAGDAGKSTHRATLSPKSRQRIDDVLMMVGRLLTSPRNRPATSDHDEDLEIEAMQVEARAVLKAMAKAGRKRKKRAYPEIFGDEEERIDEILAYIDRMAKTNATEGGVS